MLELTTSTHGSYCVVEVVGEVDIATSPQLRDRISELVADGHRHFAVDLSGVEFIDSTGLGVLVGGKKKAQAQDGTFCLVAMDPGVDRIMQITSLHSVFASYPSLEELPPVRQAPDPGAPTV